MTRAELQKILDWTYDKLATGAEPPWAWYQYMKLRETLEAIISGMEAATPTKSSPLSEPHSESSLRLVVDNDPQDSAQHHLAGLPVQMPM